MERFPFRSPTLLLCVFTGRLIVIAGFILVIRRVFGLIFLIELILLLVRPKNVVDQLFHTQAFAFGNRLKAAQEWAQDAHFSCFHVFTRGIRSMPRELDFVKGVYDE